MTALNYGSTSSINSTTQELETVHFTIQLVLLGQTQVCCTCAVGYINAAVFKVIVLVFCNCVFFSVGQVLYDVRGILEKNRDTFRDDILNMLKDSRWSLQFFSVICESCCEVSNAYCDGTTKQNVYQRVVEIKYFGEL